MGSGRPAKHAAITIVVGDGGRDDPDAAPPARTSPDPKDGHTHDIPSWAIDDEGNGSTAPASTVSGTHVHAIVDREVLDSVHGDYVSVHERIERPGEEKRPPSGESRVE